MSEANELVVLKNLNPLTIFTENGADPLLEAIKKEVGSFIPDISTVKGRKEIASLANKVAKSKVYLDDLGKDLVSEWKEKSKKVDLERKKIRDTLDSLKEEVRKPLTEFEEKEELRIKALEGKISHLASFLTIDINQGSNNLKLSLAEIELITIDSSWQEFQERANRTKESSVKFLVESIVKRTQYEQEQIELENFRKQEEIRKQKDHEENIAKEAANKAREEAERLASEVALKAKQEADRLENEKKEALKRQAQAEENARIAEEKAAQEKIDAESRAKEAAKKAESDKIKAIEKAREEERVFAVKKKEQEEKEQAKREANTKHLKLINGEALTALIACTGISEDLGKKVITAIAKGEIPNVKINY